NIHNKDRLALCSIKCGAYNHIISTNFFSENSQDRAWQASFNACSDNRQISFLLLSSIVKIGYKHTNASNGTAKKCCRAFVYQISGPCGCYQECSKNT